LETAGYVEDLTPTLKNRPHTYRDTGKAGLYMGLSTVNDVDSEIDENDNAVNDVDSTVNVNDSQSQLRVLEDSIKKETKKQEEENSEKTQILKNLNLAAPTIFQNNFTGWRTLERHLEEPGVQLHREDGQLLVSGVGMKAAIYQDWYGRAFSSALSGIYNHDTQVEFVP
jgi:hypothetical protein